MIWTVEKYAASVIQLLKFKKVFHFYDPCEDGTYVRAALPSRGSTCFCKRVSANWHHCCIHFEACAALGCRTFD